MFIGEVYCTSGPHSIVDRISSSSLTSNDQQRPTLSIQPLRQVALEPLAKLIVDAANQKAMAVASSATNAAATLGDGRSHEDG